MGTDKQPDNRPFYEIPEKQRSCPTCQGRLVYWTIEAGEAGKAKHVRHECIDQRHPTPPQPAKGGEEKA